MYNSTSTGILQEGTKITTTRRCLTIYFAVKTDKIAFLYLKKNTIHFDSSNNTFQAQAFVVC